MNTWEGFLVVAAATLLSAGATVLFFALGVRLGAEGRDPGRRSGVRALAAASRACHALSGAPVLFGLYLIVPLSHPQRTPPDAALGLIRARAEQDGTRRRRRLGLGPTRAQSPGGVSPSRSLTAGSPGQRPIPRGI
jgi:hypothetical protein